MRAFRWIGAVSSFDPGTGGGLTPQQSCDYPESGCDVYGGGWGGGWSFGGGFGGGSGGGSSGGDCSADPYRCEPSPPPEELICERGSGDVRMTFDGRTIRVTAGYSYSGQDLASLQAYVAGIESIWTLDFPAEGIGIVVDLVPDPDGFAITLDPNYHGREELQPNPGGNWEMRLGPFTGATAGFVA